MAHSDVERFERVILPHLDDAYTLAHYLLRDEHDVQDAVQEAVLRALRFFHGYRDGDPRAWLLTIVRNCCHSWQRSRRTDRLTVEYGDDDVSTRLYATERADSRAIAASDQAAITRAVAALPVEYREVIVLRELHELSYKEISNMTGVPMGTVMSRLARARERLADALGMLERGVS